MRAFRLAKFITVPSAVRLQSVGNYGHQSPRDNRHRPPQHQQRFGAPRDSRLQRGPPPPALQGLSQGGCGNRLNEPQLVAKLLEHFPAGKSSVPVNKWAPHIPEDVQEALVPFGGLAHFAASQTNFFIVRKENGLTIVSLSTMASTLCVEREKTIKKREERAAEYAARRREQSRRSH